MRTITDLIERNDWLRADVNRVVKLPLLVKGTLVSPPEVSYREIRAAFEPADAKRGAADPHQTVAEVRGALIAREAIVDRETMTLTGDFRYHLMPKLSPADLIEHDIAKLHTELYSIGTDEVLRWLDLVRDALNAEHELVGRVRELDRATSEHPDAFVDTAFTAIPLMLDSSSAAAMIDADLGREGIAGRRFLDGWQTLGANARPGPVHLVGNSLLPNRSADPESTQRAQLRAMPTRQLHITAGNSPLVPLVSMLRAVWTKSAGTIKLPYGATLPGAMLAIVAATAAPEHPITRHLSMVYWRGGDADFEKLLFSPGAYDRIVVWGAPAAVASVKQRALFTKTLCFNPRYSVSLIGKNALADVDDTARRALFDTMVQNQKACIASQVHYVEGDVADAKRYAAALQRELARWDELAPQLVLPRQRGQLIRLQRGTLLDASFHLNQSEHGFHSGAVVVPHEFRIGDHPMSRLVVVRPVAALEDALGYFHHGVATVGVHPESRRLELRDRIAARGVSNIVPLGQSARTFSGMSHDGMVVLSELVDWKNG